MTVRELIEELERFDPEMEVLTPDPGCSCCSGDPWPPEVNIETHTDSRWNPSTRRYEATNVRKVVFLR